MRGTITFLLLFFAFSFLFRTDTSFDQDLGRHLKLGEIIVKTGQVPKTNLFSYTNPNFPFINTHWLFEVLTYFFNQTVGLEVLLILKIVIILISIWLVVKNVPEPNRTLLLPVGFIFLHVLRERIDLRPEIFSFLFTCLTIFILEKFLKQKTRLIFLLPLIQLIWINTHIYFFVGLLLQVIYIIYIGYQTLRFHPRGVSIKILLMIFGLSVILSLINPNGLSGFLYPLNVQKNYGYTIVENQTISFLENIGFSDPNFLFVKLALGLIFVSFLIGLVRKKIDLKNFLLALTGAILALLNVRSFPYLVFLSLSPTLQNFGPIKPNLITKIVILVAVGTISIESIFYLSGGYYRSRDDQNQSGLSLVESGKGALDFVLSNDLEGPIFNNFDIGSYIIYRAYPKLKVFVDGRPEAYPKDFFSLHYIHMQADPAAFQIEDKKWHFQTIIFSYTDQTSWGKTFVQFINQDPNWKLVYLDDFMMILVEPNIQKEKKLKIINLAELSPDYYNFSNHVSYIRLGYFLLSTQNTEAGKKFIEKAYQLYPKSPIAKSMLGI